MVKGAILALAGLLVVRILAIGNDSAESNIFWRWWLLRRALVAWIVVLAGLLWMFADMLALLPVFLGWLAANPLAAVFLVVLFIALAGIVLLGMYWVWDERRRKSPSARK
jgi:hypothetical protein